MARSENRGHLRSPRGPTLRVAADLRTRILDFGGFDSSVILVLRAGIPRPIVVGDSPGNFESLNLGMISVEGDLLDICI